MKPSRSWSHCCPMRNHIYCDSLLSKWNNRIIIYEFISRPINIGVIIHVIHHHHHHHHHHGPDGLGVFPVPWSSRLSWSLHLFFGRPMFLRPFGLHRSACFGSLFGSILCTCCNHFFWYSFISFTMFCAPVFCLIHWFLSLSSFVIPSKCLKNSISAASKRCSSLFFSTQASLPNFNTALSVMLWILNFVSLFKIKLPKTSLDSLANDSETLGQLNAFC